MNHFLRKLKYFSAEEEDPREEAFGNWPEDPPTPPEEEEMEEPPEYSGGGGVATLVTTNDFFLVGSIFLSLNPEDHPIFFKSQNMPKTASRY